MEDIYNWEDCDFQEDERIKNTDKSLRATFQHVLDPQTCSILTKLVNENYISEIHGCVARGKEASVFHAFHNDTPDTKQRNLNANNIVNQESYAVKIYFTSVLIFKHREKYTNGDFRFRRGWKKKNAKNMVQIWAKKEYKNLLTLYDAGLPVPKPIIVRSNVLLMQYLGTEDLAAPRLRDAEISTSEARELYLDLVNYMWIMYRVCHLVHADLSEYNLLYFKGKAYIIDVSQSVSPDHPCAQEFLCQDCFNINEFFRKKGVPTLTLTELFDYIVDLSITKYNREERLDELREAASDRYSSYISHTLRIEEELFKDVYVSKCLNQAVDYDRYIGPSRRELETLEEEDDIADSDDCDESKYEENDICKYEENENSYEPKYEENDKSEFNHVNEWIANRMEKKLLTGLRCTPGRNKNESKEEKKFRKKFVKMAQAERRQTNNLLKFVF